MSRRSAPGLAAATFGAEVDRRRCQGRLAVVGFDQIVFAAGERAVGLGRDVCGSFGIPGGRPTAAGERKHEGGSEGDGVEQFHDWLVKWS